MQLKRQLACTLIALFSGSLWADDVRINVTGEITARTCQVINNSDRTIDMRHYTIDQVTNQPAGSILSGAATEMVDIRCPAGHGITVNMKDTGNPAAPAGRAYLENIAPANDHARNVGVRVYLLVDAANNNNGGPMDNLVDKEVRPENTNLNYTSATDQHRIGIRPFYYFIGAGNTVTTGAVKATMTLTIKYK